MSLREVVIRKLRSVGLLQKPLAQTGQEVAELMQREETETMLRQLYDEHYGTDDFHKIPDYFVAEVVEPSEAYQKQPNQFHQRVFRERAKIQAIAEVQQISGQHGTKTMTEAEAEELYQHSAEDIEVLNQSETDSPHFS